MPAPTASLFKILTRLSSLCFVIPLLAAALISEPALAADTKSAETKDATTKAADAATTPAKTSTTTPAATKKTPSNSKKGASMSDGKNPIVVMETSSGVVEMEIFADKAPISAANFMKYVDDGFYNGTIFHRVIPNFMIQGGGFTEGFEQKKTGPQIKNEATNGLKNTTGTLAMARTGVVDSATAQFFINVNDNDFLNHRSTNPQDFGYAVFGKVTSGMDVVTKIKAVPTTSKGGHQDVPVTPVLIKSMKRK